LFKTTSLAWAILTGHRARVPGPGSQPGGGALPAGPAAEHPVQRYRI